MTYLGAIGILLVAAAVGITPDARDEAPASADQQVKPAACQLSPGGYAERLAEIDDLFADSEATRELEDGYAFRFPGDADQAGQLLDLINAERQCCRFLKFELIFEPYEGAIWFGVRGSTEVKSTIESMMGE